MNKSIAISLEFRTKNLRIIWVIQPEYYSEPETKFEYKVITYWFWSKHERDILQCGWYESFESCKNAMLSFIEENFSLTKF